jgi:hypothetical protein
MPGRLTDAQADATVVTANGEPVGTVASVEDGVAYVAPDADAPDTLTATLGWDAGTGAGGEDDEGVYPLPRTAIDSADEEEIRLHRGGEGVDRSDTESAHNPDVDPAREGGEGSTDVGQKAEQAARESEAEQEVETSIEREASAEESSNPNAHRDEEPFDS